MKKKTIIIVIGLMSFALLGLIGLQAYWIYNFYKLKRDHFDNIVYHSLNKVNDSIIQIKLINYKDSLEFNDGFFTNKDSLKLLFTNDSLNRKLQSYYNTIKNISPKVFSDLQLDYSIIDSILKSEMLLFGINTSIKYGVWSARADTFIYLNDKDIDFVKLNSKYKTPLSSELKDDIKLLLVYFPKQGLVLFKRMLFVLVPSLLLILIILGSFWFAIRIILRQKKLSEMKTDFINNLTHEFKTPISTISLAIEGLLNYDIRNNQEKAEEYLQIAKNENSRLGMMVGKVLKIAAYERKELNLKIEKININEIIEKVCHNFEVQVDYKQGMIHKDLNQQNPIIEGDKEHITNVIFNLFDNANKYTSGKPEIKIQTHDLGDNISITISDNGIGIPKNQLKSIFNKFYRIPTKYMENVKGFGLGLNYVLKIIEKHNGTINVQSELNVGSTFEIILPKKHG